MSPSASNPRSTPQLTLTVLLPFYNERDYLPATLGCLMGQTRRPDEVILVDNGSTDGSGEWCREWMRICPLAIEGRVRLLREPTPGKTHALRRGLSEVTGNVVATWDADMVYPVHYLAKAEAMLAESKPDIAAVMALYLHGLPNEGRHRRRRVVMPLISRFFPTKCLTGGGGQIFRSEALRLAGGFDAERWPYVLLDHEIMNRVFKVGKTRYHRDLWCLHTERRGDRKRVRWTVWERFLYLYMPPALLDWFFYRYLAAQFAGRRLSQGNLREQPWKGAAPASA